MDEDTTPTAHSPLLKRNTTDTAMGIARWDADDDANAEFGGAEARRELEKELLWKVDKRMSILILIYVLNYVSLGCNSLKVVACSTSVELHRLTGIMRGMWHESIGCMRWVVVLTAAALQCCPTAWLRRRPRVEGPAIRHSPFSAVHRLYLNSDTLVRLYHAQFTQSS